EQAKTRPLVLIAGFIHDVSSFIDEHPGGRHLIRKNIGKDATTAFFGGVYDHSNAAHNLLAMMRVGVLRGGLELESEKAIPPSQRLQIIRGQALAHLKEEASRTELSARGKRDGYGDHAGAGNWDDIKGLPSPPLSTGPLDSGDEAASISGEMSGGRSD
ncbi:hypothetical protein FRC16_006971, partial [Serendipita sp. 398]